MRFQKLRSRFGLGSATAIAALVLTAGTAGAASAPQKPQRPVCPGPVALGAARCHAHVVTNSKGAPQTSTLPKGYGPKQFHGAYSLPATSASSAGQTVAIVDAYNDPNIASDLKKYDETFGLPTFPTCNATVTASCFAKVNQSGSASGPFPTTNSGWALEIALDVEVAHATCQNCKVLLVEANSSSLTNLEAAVNTAANLGATEISNSYGGSEFSGETLEANAAAYDKPGIAVTVSSGDNGYGSFGFPAASPYVVAVGGTTLNLNADNSYSSETVWNGTGSGCSNYVAAPEWQTSLTAWGETGCGTKRGVADVAADADPNTGAAVYDSVKYQGRSGWFQVGGTSLSSPLVAGVYALAGGVSSEVPAAQGLYVQLGSANLHDVTNGSDGTCSTIMCKAGTGYDGPTGVGTPNGLAGF
ncbi:MAG TPA: S53 family peptidase [Solirubrobacterales bacterium]|nr:S53 family peptidase [Solirubrobacterales bacterium]